MQGMVALGALSYLLELDGQKTLADHYDQTNKNFINYFLENAKVSDYYSISSSFMPNFCHYDILIPSYNAMPL